MLERQTKAIDRVFHALAHPVRREILRRIGADERSVTELSEPFDMTLEAVSQHIRVLEGAGLLRRTRAGRAHLLRVVPGPLDTAATTLSRLARHWERRLDALDATLHEKRK